MKQKLFLIITAFTMAIILPAYSHPHGWLGVKSLFVFNNKMISKIKTQWKFDDMNSEMIMENVDRNKNNTVEPSEMKFFIEEVKSFFSLNMSGKNYFSVIKVDGKPYKNVKITNKTAAVEKGKVVLKFDIDLLKPIDPVNSKVMIDFYDDSYFYDVYFDENNPIEFTGDKPANCSYKLGEDLSYTYYFDMVNPQQVKLECLN